MFITTANKISTNCANSFKQLFWYFFNLSYNKHFLTYDKNITLQQVKILSSEVIFAYHQEYKVLYFLLSLIFDIMHLKFELYLWHWFFPIYIYIWQLDRSYLRDLGFNTMLKLPKALNPILLFQLKQNSYPLAYSRDLQNC